MGAPRGEFSSRLGFILAASGSAVGLGNIWGFPTQAASNGGAAFLLVYLLLAFLIAYPALMAELIIGRHAKANAVTALRSISNDRFTYNLGSFTGYLGIATASVILGFYAIVAGWMFAYAMVPVSDLLGMGGFADWLTGFAVGRNLIFMTLFMFVTIAIICGGVQKGIEKWCTRLMPSLLFILVALIVYVLTLDGAGEGLKAYLVPDFSRIADPQLVISAMGQAFFSLSLGVGGMLIYASYVSDKEDIVSLGRSVTLLDIGIAVMAGLLILPAMYVAQNNGVAIYDAAGNLISEDTLIFAVLPALFETMGTAGIFVALAFFVLMSIAALTSSISMLEVPVAYAVENHGLERKRATYLAGGVIIVLSGVIILNFEALFGLAIAASTRYGQPLLGLLLCVFAGWIWHRDGVLNELKKGNPDAEQGPFWKIWPFYVRTIVPAAIIIVFVQSLR
ncbi:MAG: sodium-dependent transporter [Woeseiaceae bacterium]|nr:sodium-dependent transporter [Woeseiaceae bacterium]